MTSGEDCSIISYNVIIRIERNTDNNDPYRKCVSVCANKKMQDIHTDLVFATNYLIQLFYQTNKTYVCTRTKIGKLLSIVAFVYAKDGKKMFDENICRYDGCGTTIKELAYIIEHEVYPVSSNLPNQKEITEISQDPNIPDRFLNIGSLNDNVKENIKKVFLKFGSYSPKNLGELLNELFCCNKIKTYDNVTIDLEVFSQISRDDFINRNELIDFIFS